MKGTIRTFILTLATVSLITGCASTGIKRSDKLDSTLAGTRVGMEAMKPEIDEILESLNQLKQKDIVVQDVYPIYKKEVGDISASVAKISKNTALIKQAAQVKFDAWNTSLDSIQNEKLKKASEKQLALATKNNDALLNLLSGADKVITPFMDDLLDIQKYLDLDSTTAGVKKISSQIKIANKTGGKVKNWIDKVVVEIAKLEKRPTEQ